MLHVKVSKESLYSSHFFTDTAHNALVVLYRRPITYHIVKHGNNCLKCMQILAQGRVEMVDKCRRIKCLNLPNTREQDAWQSLKLQPTRLSL